jgi:hypothetical protein
MQKEPVVNLVTPEDEDGLANNKRSNPMNMKHTHMKPTLAADKDPKAMSSNYAGLDLTTMLEAQGRAGSALVAANQRLIEGMQQLWAQQLKATSVITQQVLESGSGIFTGSSPADVANRCANNSKLITETALEAMRNTMAITSKCCTDVLSAFGEQMTTCAPQGPYTQVGPASEKTAA